jgi:hypothetical protein
MAYNFGNLSVYTEQQSLPLITRALFRAKSASILTPMVGVKSAKALNLLNTDAVFQSGNDCGWSASGTTTFSNRIMNVAKIKVHEPLCPKKLEDYWMQTQVLAGSNPEQIPFEAQYADLKVGKIAEQLETAIWQGDAASGNTNANTNKFDGLIKLINAASGSTVSGNTGAVSGVTVSNAFAVFQAMYNRIPTTILDAPDLRIVCGWDYFRLLVANLTNLNLFSYAPTVDGVVGEITLPGTNVTVVALNGLNGTNRIFAMRLSNVFWGVDLLNEEDRFEIFYAKEAMEVRFIAEFKAGVQFAYAEEIVQFTLAS